MIEAWLSLSEKMCSFLPDQGRDGAEVGLVARGEAQRLLLAHESGKPLLQLLVQGEGPVQEPGARAARPPFPRRLDGGFLDPGVPGQAEVVVGAGHDELLALHDHLRAPAFLDGLEIGVDALFLGILRIFPRCAFVKNVHGSLLTEHEAATLYNAAAVSVKSGGEAGCAPGSPTAASRTGRSSPGSPISTGRRCPWPGSCLPCRRYRSWECSPRRRFRRPRRSCPAGRER